MTQLGVSTGHRKLFRRILIELEEKGDLVRLDQNKIAPATSGNETKNNSSSVTMVKGVLSLHPHGFGFLALDEDNFFKDAKGNDMEELFIPPSAINTARHGDRVLAKVVENTRGKRSGQDLLEGVVQEVIERGTALAVGILRNSGGNWQLIPDDARIQGPVRVRDLSGQSPKNGFKAVVLLDDRMDPRQNECGILQEVIGKAGEPGVDILSIMRGHGLISEFPEDVNAEAYAFVRAVNPKDIEERRDFREELIFTIDPQDARDFDDALHVTEIEGKPGWLRVGIHIADVAHFVKPGGALDREALQRGTSAYLVDRVVPMLPEHLTNDLCSLVPHQDRLAHSVILDINTHGSVKAVDTCQSVIHSKQRLTYEQAQVLISGGQISGVDKAVRDAVVTLARLTRKLRKTRMREHALAFEMPEIRCILDENGDVTGFYKKEAMEAYQLVEECMLMANREVGALLSARFGTAIYRIHEEPTEEDFQEMAEQLRQLGVEGIPVSRESLNEIIGRQMPEPLKQAVSLTLLKNMNRALYSPELGEHFGLAFDTYTHFTSPIRRYPDLVAHRLLLAIEENKKKPISDKKLRELCRHCSERERAAAEAEKESHRIKMFQYYEQKLKNGETGPYPATISNVLFKGVLAELDESGQRGLIPFTAFKDDYFEANETGTRATGRSTGQVLQLGDKIEVHLDKIDMENHQMDFRL
jgi:ribonuclease R